MTYAEGLQLKLSLPNAMFLLLSSTMDDRSLYLPTAGAGSEREIPINHRRADGGEQESERARSHSVSPSLIHALISPVAREISQTFLLIWEFK